MKHMQAEHTCTVCQQNLKWWNTQKCVDCGHTICNHHACVLKQKQFSSVLYTYCLHCGKQHMKAISNTPKQHLERTTIHA